MVAAHFRNQRIEGGKELTLIYKRSLSVGFKPKTTPEFFDKGTLRRAFRAWQPLLSVNEQMLIHKLGHDELSPDFRDRLFDHAVFRVSRKWPHE